MAAEFDERTKTEYKTDYPKEEFNIAEEAPEDIAENGAENGNIPGEIPSHGRDRPTEADDPDRALIIPHRRLIKVVKYLARSNKAALTAGILTLVMLGLFGIAFMQEHMGQFTINLNRVDMWRRALSMSETADFANPTSRLTVSTIKRTTNIARSDIPWEDVNVGDGDKSGKDYICYSFYIRNGGIEDVDCGVSMKMIYKSKGAENAIRIAVIKDGANTVYAMPAASGRPEPDTVPFVSDKIVMEDTLENFKIDDVHKYTIVMWIDGDDPECVNDIIGGSVRFQMDFDTGESREVSFIELIKELPLFRGAIEDDSLGDKDDRAKPWKNGEGQAPGDENEAGTGTETGHSGQTTSEQN